MWRGFVLVMITVLFTTRRGTSLRSARRIAAVPRHSYRVRVVEDDGGLIGPGRKFQPTPFPYHHEMELRIDDVSNLGVGVGRVQLPATSTNATSSWVVMVPLVLPGETVRVRVFRNHDTYSEADLVEVVTPSPDRVQPQCQYFSVCGGCNYQMMSLPAQRRRKQAQVGSLLARLGGITDAVVSPVVGTEHAYHYRSKITPHYDAPRKAEDLKVGFQRRGTRIIIDVDQCIIATPAINKEYADARVALMEQMSKKLPKKGATLLFREGDGAHVETDPRKNMQQQVNGITFTFKAGEFFQNNAYVLPLMVNHVLSLCKGRGSRFLIDAYCGSGLFSLCAAADFEAVYGVEVSDLAVQAAQANAQANQILNAQFLCGSSEAIFSKVKHLPSADTVVLIDPPRKGCDEQFLSQLFAFSPKRVVYVSCDPATQARDAKIMLAEGGYRITSVTPFDLFPQTRHIENVIAFERD